MCVCVYVCVCVGQLGQVAYKISQIFDQKNDRSEAIRWANLAILHSPSHFLACGALGLYNDKVGKCVGFYVVVVPLTSLTGQRETAAKMIRRALEINPWLPRLPTCLLSLQYDITS